MPELLSVAVVKQTGGMLFVLDLGMDMSGFSSAMSAMMMSPSFQAVMNPFLMSGNGGALLNQLLSQGQFFPNWATPQLPTKTLSQLWMMNSNKVSIDCSSLDWCIIENERSFNKILIPYFQANMRVEEEEDNEDEDMGVAETYADYMPFKCNYLHTIASIYVCTR